MRSPGAFHRLDIPALNARPVLRSALIVLLCGGGLLFSLTGVVIGWRRLRMQRLRSGSSNLDPEARTG
jgi:hypothetical protein